MKHRRASKVEAPFILPIPAVGCDKRARQMNRRSKVPVPTGLVYSTAVLPDRVRFDLDTTRLQAGLRPPLTVLGALDSMVISLLSGGFTLSAGSSGLAVAARRGRRRDRQIGPLADAPLARLGGGCPNCTSRWGNFSSSKPHREPGSSAGVGRT
jgi:hypothetical protein